MFSWFDDLFFGKRRRLERRIMNLEAEIERLQEELSRKTALQNAITEDDARSRERESSRLQAAESSGVRSLLEAIAPGLADLASLRVPAPGDLLGPLQEKGLTLLGEAGHQVRFDPNRYEFVGTGQPPLAGDTVQISRVGLSYMGTRLLKGQVVRPEEIATPG